MPMTGLVFNRDETDALLQKFWELSMPERHPTIGLFEAARYASCHLQLASFHERTAI